MLYLANFLCFRNKKSVSTVVFVASKAKIVKNIAIYIDFQQTPRKTVFCDVFFRSGVTCTANTTVFFSFFATSSQSKQAKNTGFLK